MGQLDVHCSSTNHILQSESHSAVSGKHPELPGEVFGVSVSLQLSPGFLRNLEQRRDERFAATTVLRASKQIHGPTEEV